MPILLCLPTKYSGRCAVAPQDLTREHRSLLPNASLVISGCCPVPDGRPGYGITLGNGHGSPMEESRRSTRVGWRMLPAVRTRCVKEPGFMPIRKQQDVQDRLTSARGFVLEWVMFSFYNYANSRSNTATDPARQALTIIVSAHNLLLLSLLRLGAPSLQSRRTNTKSASLLFWSL